MFAQTIEEFKTHLQKNQHSYHFEFDASRSFLPLYKHHEAKCLEIPFPKTASEFSYLCVSLPLLAETDLTDWRGGTLIYTDWGIWNQQASLAGYQMVERIRQSFGEFRPFSSAPVNEFRQDERLLLASFILAALIHGWDAFYIPNCGGTFVHISHDEWACIVTETNEDFENLLVKNEEGYRLIESDRFCRRSPS